MVFPFFVPPGAWLLQGYVLSHYHNLYDFICGVWHIQKLPAGFQPGARSRLWSKHQTRSLLVWYGSRHSSGNGDHPKKLSSFGQWFHLLVWLQMGNTVQNGIYIRDVRLRGLISWNSGSQTMVGTCYLNVICWGHLIQTYLSRQSQNTGRCRCAHFTHYIPQDVSKQSHMDRICSQTLLKSVWM